MMERAGAERAPLAPAANDVHTAALQATAATLMAHPLFENALLLSAQAIVDNYQGNWVINRIANDRGRMIMALMVLDLNFQSEGTGFTVAQLRQEAGLYGFASPRRTVAWVASLRLLGFLRPVGRDRPLRLAPTDTFVALHRTRTLRQWAAVALLHPPATQARAAIADPQFLSRCAHVFVDSFRTGVRILAPVPELIPIAERDAGLTVMMSLFLADSAGRPISIAALARRFMVSRAHVLAIFREGEPTGLTARNGPRGEYRSGPALLPVMRQLLATVMATNIHAMDAALAQTALPA
jgi:hypothetical protein